MKAWVMADVVPEEGRFYLTPGKWYQVRGGDKLGGEIKTDNGVTVFCSFSDSAHLCGGDWNVHHGDTPPDAKPTINQQLLEALEEIVRYAEQYPSDMGFEDFAKTKARAAIAAAKGE